MQMQQMESKATHTVTSARPTERPLHEPEYQSGQVTGTAAMHTSGSVVRAGASDFKSDDDDDDDDDDDRVHVDGLLETDPRQCLSPDGQVTAQHSGHVPDESNASAKNAQCLLAQDGIKHHLSAVSPVNDAHGQLAPEGQCHVTRMHIAPQQRRRSQAELLESPHTTSSTVMSGVPRGRQEHDSADQLYAPNVAVSVGELCMEVLQPAGLHCLQRGAQSQVIFNDGLLVPY
jgi:hypothetical protein